MQTVLKTLRQFAEPEFPGALSHKTGQKAQDSVIA